VGRLIVDYLSPAVQLFSGMAHSCHGFQFKVLKAAPAASGMFDR
jgi:hypothetical protein